MSRGRTSLKKRRSEEEGFTLIELLVVITILGILAAIVVFAVKGIGDKGLGASKSAEASIVRTAEEAHCAKLGSYVDADTLVTDGFLKSRPSYNAPVVFAGGSCGNTGFTLGDPSFTSTAGTLFLGASNTKPPFSYMLSGFIAANGPAKFTFDSSTNLKGTANAKTGNPGVFFSADQANVDGVTTGVASTKQQYTTGRLVAFSCKSGGATLAPASGAPACKAPGGVYQTALAGPDLTDLVTRLTASGSTAKLTIADPGTKITIAGSTGNWTCTTNAGAATAPYGFAAYEALLASPANGGGGMTCNQYGDLKAANRIVYGSNVSNTQTNVVTGAADFALIPKSFVKSPAGDDTDNWFTVNSAAHTPIAQWAIVIDLDGNGAVNTADEVLGQKFLQYVTSPTGKAVMAQFGYDPAP
jgi:prepilin-type N-terminal cleavage/methylation domain-containing protein